MAIKAGVKKIGRLPIEDMTDLKISSGKIKTMKIIANETVNHFVAGFEKGGGQGGGQTDLSKSGWKRRQSREAGRGILVKRGDLHRDITRIKVTDKIIIVGTTRIPYAARHNEGLAGMPQREFIGPSKDLEIKNEKELVDFMDFLTKGKRL